MIEDNIIYLNSLIKESIELTGVSKILKHEENKLCFWVYLNSNFEVGDIYFLKGGCNYKIIEIKCVVGKSLIKEYYLQPLPYL